MGVLSAQGWSWFGSIQLRFSRGGVPLFCFAVWLAYPLGKGCHCTSVNRKVWFGLHVPCLRSGSGSHVSTCIWMSEKRAGFRGRGWPSPFWRLWRTNCPPVELMRCAKGIVAKGILGGTGFSLLRWKKGSETPSCGGKKDLRLPRSSCSDLGNEGVYFPPQEGVSDPFFHRKRENPVPPKIPLATIPLAQRMMNAF